MKTISLILLLTMTGQIADDGALDDEGYGVTELERRIDNMGEALNDAAGYICSRPEPQRSRYRQLRDDYDLLLERASVILDRHVQVEIRTRSCERFNARRFSRAIRQAEIWQRRVEAELKRAEG